METVDLSSKRLGPASAIVIAKCLEGKSALTSLNLQVNKIGPTGATALAEALKVSSALKNLDLSDNNLTNSGEDMSGVLAIADALKPGTSAVIKLNISNNNITDDAKQALQSAAASHRQPSLELVL